MKKDKNKYHRFTLLDVQRIIDALRLRRVAGDAKIMSSILHVFGVKDAVCAIVAVAGVLDSIGFITFAYGVLKIMKAVLVVINLTRGASLRIIKASVFMFSFEIGTTILTKVTLRFVALGAALDIIIGALAIYADFLASVDPFRRFLNLVCAEETNEYVNRAEAVVYGLEAAEIASRIAKNQLELTDAIAEVNGVSNEM